MKKETSSEEQTEDRYCMLATFDNPRDNYTKWCSTYAQAKEDLLKNDEANANIAIGKRISLEDAQEINDEVCFAFDDGTESVYEGGEIPEAYRGLPLITFTFDKEL